MIRHLRAVLLASSAVAASASSQPATVDLRVEHAPLFTLIERIARQCDAGLAVDAALSEKMQREVTLNAKDAPWKDALALLESEYGISLALAGDRLVVGDADTEFRKRLVRRSYDVRTLTHALLSFPGPDLGIPDPGGQGAKLLPPIEQESKPDTNEIGDVIRKHVQPSTWSREGIAIEESNGALVITQTPEAQDEILALLERLERTAAREVVCRAYRLAPPPGIVRPVIDAETWRGLAKEAGAPVASFVMIDGQQNHHFSGAQALYVADTDVVQGVNDPIVTVISKGLSIDVEPQATVDGVIATIRFDATIAQDATTTPVLDLAGKPLAVISQPRSSSDISRDSRPVPKGGAALLLFGERAYAVTFEVLDWPEQATPKK